MSAHRTPVPLSFFGIAVGQLAVGLALNGRMWMGGRPPELVTPALYLPSVAQGFVAAAASAAFGWHQLGMLFFGVGLLAWLARRVAARRGLASPRLALTTLHEAAAITASRGNA